MITNIGAGTFLGLRDEHGHEIHCAHAKCPHDAECYKGCADRVALVVGQGQVNEELNHAMENGYVPDVSKPAAENIAEIVADLQKCSSDCEGEPDEVLTPLVKAWYDARQFGDSQAGKAADC